MPPERGPLARRSSNVVGPRSDGGHYSDNELDDTDLEGVLPHKSTPKGILKGSKLSIAGLQADEQVVRTIRSSPMQGFLAPAAEGPGEEGGLNPENRSVDLLHDGVNRNDGGDHEKKKSPNSFTSLNMSPTPLLEKIPVASPSSTSRLPDEDDNKITALGAVPRPDRSVTGGNTLQAPSNDSGKRIIERFMILHRNKYGGPFPLRYCQRCQHFQPRRTRHCKGCGFCVNKFDHHCFWIGGCVGEKNHP